MADSDKRSLSEVQEILAQAEKFLGSVTIPLLKSIIFSDLGFDKKFVFCEIGDKRKLTDWYEATVKALAIRQEEHKIKSIRLEIE